MAHRGTARIKRRLRRSNVICDGKGLIYPPVLHPLPRQSAIRILHAAWRGVATPDDY